MYLLWCVTIISRVIVRTSIRLFLFPVGLLPYCNFGKWSAEEDEQLKKNFAEIAKVCMNVISNSATMTF